MNQMQKYDGLWRRCKASLPSHRSFVPLILLFLLFSLRQTATAHGAEIEIRYAVPTFAMKLIVLDNNVSLATFQSTLDDAVHNHMRNYFQEHLPENEGEPLERTSFVDVSLESVIDRTPIALEENLDPSVHLSVIRSGFDGFCIFSYNQEFVTNSGINATILQDEAILTSILLDSFRQNKGFWDFAELISNDEILSVTGKIQISVNNVMVAEADLVNDNPEIDDDRDLSSTIIGIISLACLVFACIVAIVVAVLYLRNKEKELERKSRQRREYSQQFRNKSLGSSSSLGQSISSNSEASWTDTRIKTANSGPNRMEKGSMFLSQANASAAWDSKKLSSSDILLDIIEEEPTNYEDMTSRYSDKASTRSPEHDPDDSEFYSVRSCSSHHEENNENWCAKNVIVSVDSPLRVHSPISSKKCTVVPILKPSLKYTSTVGNGGGRPSDKMLQSCLKNGSGRKLGSGMSSNASPKRRSNSYRKINLSSAGGGNLSSSHLHSSMFDASGKCLNLDPTDYKHATVGDDRSPPRSPRRPSTKRVPASPMKSGQRTLMIKPSVSSHTDDDEDPSLRFGDDGSLSPPRKVKNGMGLSESWSFA